MANTPALVTPYVTLANAEVANAGITAWDDASDSEKNQALSHGRSFIDSKYNLQSFSETDAPAQIQMGNCLFALEYLAGTLYVEPTANSVSETVKAGPVTVSTNFARSGGTSTIDPFPSITAIMYPYAKRRSSGLSVVSAIR